MTEISDKDLELLVMDLMKQENIQEAAPTAPVYRLAETLALKKITHLRSLARALQVKNYGKLPREELTAGIIKELTSLRQLRSIFFLLDEEEMKFFQEAASKKQLIRDKVLPAQYYLAREMGLLQSFYHEDKLYFVVPQEIQDAYRQLLTTNFLEEKQFSNLLQTYAAAAVSLYGVISQADLVTRFNRENQRQTTVDELFARLLIYVERKSGYCFYHEYIVSDFFEEDDFQGVEELLKARSLKPPYNPPREEFLRYADWTYYEQTPQIIALQAYLADRMPDDSQVLDLVDEIHDMADAGVKMQKYQDLLEKSDIEFKNKDELKEFYDLLTGVINNTRLWWNHGHTPAEIFNHMSPGKPPIPDKSPIPGKTLLASPKIGRNDPCPCGSGKKYKQCCGK